MLSCADAAGILLVLFKSLYNTVIYNRNEFAGRDFVTVPVVIQTKMRLL